MNRFWTVRSTQAHPDTAAATAGEATETTTPPSADGSAPTTEQATADAAAAKATADAAAETARKAAEPPAQAKAPEKYALTLPEGGRLEAGDLTRIEQAARAANWSNDDAQAAVLEYDALIKGQSDGFLAETKADKDYGGDKLEETQKLARAVINRLRPEGHARRDSFNRFLNRGGAGNHIEVLAFLADLGKLMAEDGPGMGGGSGGTKEFNSPLDLYKRSESSSS